MVRSVTRVALHKAPALLVRSTGDAIRGFSIEKQMNFRRVPETARASLRSDANGVSADARAVVFETKEDRKNGNDDRENHICHV